MKRKHQDIVKPTFGKLEARPVYCLKDDDEDERILYEFPSVKKAARAMGRDTQCIVAALKGRTRTSCGFRWAYQDECEVVYD